MAHVSKKYKHKPRIVSRSECYTSVTCGSCFKIKTNLGTNKIYVFSNKDCEKYDIKVSRDGGAARSILLKNELEYHFGQNSPCWANDKYHTPGTAKESKFLLSLFML